MNEGHEPRAEISLDTLLDAVSRRRRTDSDCDGDSGFFPQPTGTAQYRQTAHSLRFAKARIDQKTGAGDRGAARGKVFDELQNLSGDTASAVDSNPGGRSIRLLCAEHWVIARCLGLDHNLSVLCMAFA